MSSGSTSIAYPDALAVIGGYRPRALRSFETYARIVVAAPSEAELERRQVSRGSETERDLAERRKIAEKEMTYASRYDRVVTNDDIDRAVSEILDIIRRTRERQATG